jgi:hypothetical protein
MFGTELVRLISLSQVAFSGSLELQPSVQKVTIDPSRCLHVNRKSTRSPFGGRCISGRIKGYSWQAALHGHSVGFAKNGNLYQHSKVNLFSVFIQALWGLLVLRHHLDGILWRDPGTIWPGHSFISNCEVYWANLNLTDLRN